MLQGLVSLLRDLVLAGAAPDRLELTGVSAQFRGELPELARSIGKARLLQWQAQLKGSEQQLRHSVNPRLWLEVLLLGLLAEAVVLAPAKPAALSPAPVTPAPVTPAAATPAPLQPAPAPQPAPLPQTPVQPDPAPQPAPIPQATATAGSPNLAELWQQILAGLELPSTRMLLSQQAQLVRLDERRAVVQVAGNWMAMVQSRLPLLETAVTNALGSPRQLLLEGGGAHSPPPAPAAPAPQPAASPVQSKPPVQAAQPQPAAELNPASKPPPPMAPLDEKARRLAEFFNGEVVDLDGPLEGIGPDDAAA